MAAKRKRSTMCDEENASGPSTIKKETVEAAAKRKRSTMCDEENASGPSTIKKETVEAAAKRKRSTMCDEENASGPSTIKKETFKKNFNPFTSDFGEIVELKSFVDKTELIRTIFHDDTPPGILITAPRRFGKSTNMDMVKKFVKIQVDDDGVVVDTLTSTNRNFFKNTLIYQDEKFFDTYFATFPVIHLDFKVVNGDKFVEVLDEFRYVVHEAFEEHKYLLKSGVLESLDKAEFNRYYDIGYNKLTKAEVHRGLKILSKCLYKHFGKEVFVLIDEYDAPINNTMFEPDIDIAKVNKLLNQIFSNTLKNNPFVERALLTGISYFAAVGLSATSNIIQYKFLSDHDFVPYYGLTEGEVAKLLTDFNIKSETAEKVKLYYNGYLSSNRTKLFSIWSILNFLQFKKFKNYWSESGVVMNLKEAMNDPVVRCRIEALCVGKSVDVTLVERIELEDVIELKKICSQKDSATCKIKNPDLYLSFLFQQGYLTCEDQFQDQLEDQLEDQVKNQLESKLSTVRAPNDEIRVQLKNALVKYYISIDMDDCIITCAVSFEKIFSSSTYEDEIFKDFKKTFIEVLDKFKDKFLKVNEDTYHCIMFSILSKTKYKFGTEFSVPRPQDPSKWVRPDIIVTKDNLGMIIELKHNYTSTEALDQILETYLPAFIKTPFSTTVKIYICVGLDVGKNNVVDICVLYVNATDVKSANSKNAIIVE